MSEPESSDTTTETIETTLPWVKAQIRTKGEATPGKRRPGTITPASSTGERPEKEPIIQTEWVRPVSRAEEMAKVRAAEALARARQATAEAASIGRRLERLEMRANSLSRTIANKRIELNRLRQQLEELKPATLKTTYKAAFLKYNSYGGPAGSFRDPATGNELLHAGNLLSNASEARNIIQDKIKAREIELEEQEAELAKIDAELDDTASAEEAEQKAI